MTRSSSFITWAPAAHTTNDVIAWLPEHRILFSGDLVFNGGTPFVLTGSVSGSIAALDRLEEFDAEMVPDPAHRRRAGLPGPDRRSAVTLWSRAVLARCEDGSRGVDRTGTHKLG